MALGERFEWFFIDVKELTVSIMICFLDIVLCVILLFISPKMFKRNTFYMKDTKNIPQGTQHSIVNINIISAVIVFS